MYFIIYESFWIIDNENIHMTEQKAYFVVERTFYIEVQLKFVNKFRIIRYEILVHLYAVHQKFVKSYHLLLYRGTKT